VAKKATSPADADLLSVKRLTARDREHLATISTRLRVRAGTTIFERGDPATAIYNITSGAACSFRTLSRQSRRVMAFLFAEDIFGLSRGGRYVNTVHALTPLTIFRIPLDALKTMLLRNPELQLHFLCKVTQALRESQRHTILIGAARPVARVSRFLVMMEQAQPQHDADIVHLPMTREDIGDYLDLPTAGVGAALTDLAKRRIVSRDGAHRIRILDRRQLAALAGEP
jgi:CRP-like cAMP-binding protein